jgi:hypothetical protein
VSAALHCLSWFASISHRPKFCKVLVDSCPTAAGLATAGAGLVLSTSISISDKRELSRGFEKSNVISFL